MCEEAVCKANQMMFCLGKGCGSFMTAALFPNIFKLYGFIQAEIVFDFLHRSHGLVQFRHFSATQI